MISSPSLRSRSDGLNTHLLPQDDGRSIAEVISYRLIIVPWQESDHSPLTKAIATIVLVEFGRSILVLEVGQVRYGRLCVCVAC